MGVLAIVACIVLAPPPSTPAPRSRPAAEAAELALAHYEAGRFAEARAAIARAYMIEPWPEYLYARAQIERGAGDCMAAREFYGLYLAEGPPDKGAALAREGIAQCPVDPPPQQQQPAEIAPPSVGADSRVVDAFGVALTATGGAALVVGAGLYIGAAAQRRAAGRAPTHDRFGDHTDRARRLGIAATAMVSIGAAVALAGAVRLLVLRRRNRPPSQLAWYGVVGISGRW